MEVEETAGTGGGTDSSWSCICGKEGEIIGSFGVSCSQCKDWFHSQCVNLKDEVWGGHDRCVWLCRDCRKSLEPGAYSNIPGVTAPVPGTLPKVAEETTSSAEMVLSEDRQYQIELFVVDRAAYRWSVVNDPQKGDSFSRKGRPEVFVCTQWTPESLFYVTIDDDGKQLKTISVPTVDVIVVPPPLIDEDKLPENAIDLGFTTESRIKDCRLQINSATSRLVQKGVLINQSNKNGEWHRIDTNNEYYKCLISKFS